MLRIRMKTWTGRCPRHPRYRPVDGLGAIKGGCRYCWKLLKIHQAYETLLDEIVSFDDAIWEASENPAMRLYRPAPPRGRATA